jgi:RimJ/RimL family protein N-acetyltransferase
MTTYLETERIRLRTLTPADAPLLLDLDSDPEVMRYITDGVPATAEDVAAYLPRVLRHYETGGDFGFWAAEERATGAFVGWFHFRLGPDAADGVELGYRLRRAAWGRGYATEVSAALVRRGFERLGVERVFALTMSSNRASRRVMEKVGLRYVGDYVETRFPGEDKRAVIYAVTRSEFLAG